MTIHKQFRKAKPTYTFIKNNAGLYWLNKKYPSNELGQSPLEEYHTILIRLRIILILNVIIVVAIIISLITVSGLASYLSQWIKDEELASANITFISIASCLGGIAISIVFEIYWWVFTECWLEITWQSRNFFTEVYRINEGSPLNELGGNGEEIAKERVPGHIKTYCDGLLSTNIIQVKQWELGITNKPPVPTLTTNKREYIKEIFDIFRRFKIIPNTPDLNTRYTEIERELKLSQKSDETLVGQT